MLKITQKPKTITLKRKRDNYAKKKIKKLLKYLRSELGSSTTHGLPYIVNTELHWFEKLFWTFSFVFCAAIIFSLLSALYERYLTALIVMSLEMDYFNWNVSFPSITLCPLYKIDEDLQAAFINESILQTDQDISQDLEFYLKAISLASLDSIQLLQIPAPDILPLINSTDYAIIAAQIFLRFYNTSLTTNTHRPIALEPVMTDMGMCHVINSNVAVFDNPSKWKVGGLGETYTKKNIELSFHDRDFFVQVQNYADSYKIYTHSPNSIILNGEPSLPFVDEGFLSFGVQMSSTRASPALRDMPLYLRKCRFVDEPVSSRYPVYSYNRCLQECRVQMIKILCGCVPHFYKPMDGEKVCNLAELKCLIQYKNEISTLSVHNRTLEKLGNVEGLPKNFRDCGCLGDCESEFYQKEPETFLAQRDMNRLKILLSFPKARKLREIIFSISDIVLKCGGVINLCTGASVISVMEFLMTVIRIPIYEIIQLLTHIYRICRKIKVLYT